jgi:glycosyltransferase involved in cell wall biosynthesis
MCEPATWSLRHSEVARRSPNKRRVQETKGSQFEPDMNILAYVHLRNIHRSTGAGRVARQLIEHLGCRTGLNVHILADQADFYDVVPKVDRPWTGFQYHLFSSDTSVQQAKWVLFNRPAAESYWPKVEIVHCTAESYVPTCNSRLVVTAHDAAYFDRNVHPTNCVTIKQQVKWRTLFGTLSRSVDMFHTVSHFSAERLAAAFPSIRSRIRVIYNGVSSIFRAPVDSSGIEFLARMGLTQEPYVLLPGGLHYRKNAKLVLEAWPILRERIPDLRLVIAGHCDPRYEHRAAALGESVLRTGFVDDSYLTALYSHARAVWFPSRYEGFGLPVLEAMACGAPVVASHCAAVPEIAGRAALLVDPDSVSDHVDAVASIIASSQLRADLQQRGKERAESFTWAASAAKLHEAYASLL